MHKKHYNNHHYNNHYNNHYNKDHHKSSYDNEPKEEEKIQDFTTFINKENLLRGIYGYGFSEPSKIQNKAVILIKSGKDIIAQSQSGTGKTGAFTLGVLESIDEKLNYPQSIIIVHTHELALQVESVINELAKFLLDNNNNKIKVALCCGKTNVSENIKNVKNAQIIIGTPGRLDHIIKIKPFDIKKIKLLIIDEADQLLNESFFPQTKEIISTLDNYCQICVFSATIPREMLKLTESFMKTPEKILIKKEQLSLKLIEQYYIEVDNDENKYEVIEDLYNQFSIGQSIIYVNSIDSAIILSKKLIENNHTVALIHSNLDSVSRIETMKLFRNGECRVLISTDLTSRGIDVQQVGVVINYELPKNFETYLHRIGRSGRFNKKGVAINLIGNKKDKMRLNDIQGEYRHTILPMPDIDIVKAFLAE